MRSNQFGRIVLASDSSGPTMASHVWTFVRDTFRSAGTLATGTVASLLAALAARLGLPDMTTAPAWVCVSGIFVTLLLASYQAWLTQVKRAESLDAEIRDLTTPTLIME